MPKEPASRLQRVLLIDDNEIDNLINERIITSSGFSSEVTVKTSTDESIQWLNTCGDDAAKLPQMIFLDLNMPGKDGFAFLELYSSLPESVHQRCKVVVLSSSISPTDINRASTNPYVIKYLNKPLTEHYLAAIEI